MDLGLKDKVALVLGAGGGRALMAACGIDPASPISLANTFKKISRLSRRAGSF